MHILKIRKIIKIKGGILVGREVYTRAKFDSNLFGQMLEKLYPKEILDECIERTEFGFEIIKDFDREVKEDGLA